MSTLLSKPSKWLNEKYSLSTKKLPEQISRVSIIIIIIWNLYQYNITFSFGLLPDHVVVVGKNKAMNMVWRDSEYDEVLYQSFMVILQSGGACLGLEWHEGRGSF